MTALIITGCVLLVLGILLVAPVSLEASLKDGKASARLRYLFFRFSLTPDALESDKKRTKKQKKASRKKKKQEAKKAKKEKDKARETLEKPATATVQTVLALLRNSRRGFRTIRRHLVFSRVRVYVCVCAEDAHQTALRYSQVCSLVSGALDVIGILFVLRKPKVGVLPDFSGEHTRYEISLRAGIRPLFAIAAGGSLFFRFLLSQRSGEVKQEKAPAGTAAK